MKKEFQVIEIQASEFLDLFWLRIYVYLLLASENSSFPFKQNLLTEIITLNSSHSVHTTSACAPLKAEYASLQTVTKLRTSGKNAY